MKIAFNRAFFDSSYSDDNAALPGRMEAAMSLIDPGRWSTLVSAPATIRQLLRVHDAAYIESIAANPRQFELARMAAGSSIAAAESAYAGEPCFACIRPPGHHAYRDRAWGYCVFNNLVLALMELRETQVIESAFVIDIDQHTGDGTRSLLADWSGATVFNPFAEDATNYLKLVESRLAEIEEVSIIAVSAGFDAYEHDIGHKLSRADFHTIGAMIRSASMRASKGRRFAVLEGGYYLPDLGSNVAAFCEGFE
ncbi:MAG: histone deacetylase family protein [Spirochaetota bacterium]